MRIFLDENFSHHLASALNALQKGQKSEDIEVLHITEQFGRGTADEEWIPKVAQMHGIVITQDFNIHRTKNLATMCSENKLGIVFFRPPKKKQYTYWELVIWVINHWQHIKETAKSEKRPFCLSIPATGKPELLSMQN